LNESSPFDVLLTDVKPEDFLLVEIAMENARDFGRFHKAALFSALIFIFISFQPRCLFAGQGDTESILKQNANTTPAQTQAEQQNYPAPDDFVIVDKQPVLKYAPEPVYPEEAIKEKIEGSVWVQVLVDSHGDVVKAVIARGSEKNAGFEESALENARQRKYEPAEKDGKPVAVWIAYKVAYKLK
jgi:TonB family protein